LAFGTLVFGILDTQSLETITEVVVMSWSLVKGALDPVFFPLEEYCIVGYGMLENLIQQMCAFTILDGPLLFFCFVFFFFPVIILSMKIWNYLIEMF
jgi:hypothetical protein